MSETILKPRSQGLSTEVAIHFKEDGGMEQIPVDKAIAQAFDAGWSAHRDGIHWKRCGLVNDELRHAWQGGWASREAAGRVGVLP
jgi:hypothetical protein